jgi:hypothetical protein
LYTGKILYSGKDNNDMLRQIMEIKGPFPKRMLRKGLTTERHFDSDLMFLSKRSDPLTGQVTSFLFFRFPVVRSSPRCRWFSPCSVALASCCVAG